MKESNENDRYFFGLNQDDFFRFVRQIWNSVLSHLTPLSKFSPSYTKEMADGVLAKIAQAEAIARRSVQQAELKVLGDALETEAEKSLNRWSTLKRYVLKAFRAASKSEQDAELQLPVRKRCSANQTPKATLKRLCGVSRPATSCCSASDRCNPSTINQ